MEISWTIFLLIIGCAVVTFIPRVLPLMILSRLELPVWAIRWLKHIPIAILTALIAQELLLSNGNFSIAENALEILAAVPTFLVAIFTRSLLSTVLTGVVSMMILRMLF